MAFEEWVGEHRVGVAMQAGERPDLVCINTGCNRIVLVDLNDIYDYQEETSNSFLRTVQAGANLVIVGRGHVENNAVLYIPDATTNLMSSNSIVFNKCQVVLGYDEDDKVFWCEIICQKGRQAGMQDKTIQATNFNGLWWITQPEMLDILLASGLYR